MYNIKMFEAGFVDRVIVFLSFTSFTRLATVI